MDEKPTSSALQHERPDPLCAGLLHVGHDVDEYNAARNARSKLTRQEYRRQATERSSHQDWLAVELLDDQSDIFGEGLEAVVTGVRPS